MIMNEENLIQAAKTGNSELVELLLDDQIDVNHVDGEGNTALILASMCGCYRVVDFLLQAKADINHQNDQGETALMLAAHKEHDKVVELLISRGANVNIKDSWGDTAIAYATRASDYGSNGAWKEELNDETYKIVIKLIIEGIKYKSAYFAFGPDDIFEFLDIAEAIVVSANLLANENDEDKDKDEWNMEEDCVPIFNKSISDAISFVTANTFMKKEQLEFCEKIKKLKEKISYTNITKPLLKTLYSQINISMPKIQEGYSGDLEVFGRGIENRFDGKIGGEIIGFLLNDDIESLGQALSKKSTVGTLTEIRLAKIRDERQRLREEELKLCKRLKDLSSDNGCKKIKLTESVDNEMVVDKVGAIDCGEDVSIVQKLGNHLKDL